MKWFLGIVFVLIIIAAGFLAFSRKTAAPTIEPTPAALDDLIVVNAPLPNSYIIATSPTSLDISGKARGNWFFEATAPIELKNTSGTIIASGHITAQGDWMTTDYIPFHTSLTFPPQPTGTTGTLIFKNDNPSGDPAKQKELDILVHFINIAQG